MAEHTLPTEAIVTYSNDDWRLQRVLGRTPGQGELLVRLVATGICHTDMVNAGEITPRILGHEGAGYVIRKGPDCTVAAEVGDAVLLSYAHCRSCHACISGHPAHCRDAGPLTIHAEELNFALDTDTQDDPRLEADAAGKRRLIKAAYFGHSSFCHAAIVKESSIFNVKDLIKNEEELKMFAPLGCGIQTGACAVVNVARVSSNDTIAVFGLGSVGLSALMAAKAIGIKTIIAVDILPNRLDLASQLGATHTINSKSLSKEGLIAAIRGIDVFDPEISGMSAPFGPSAVVDTTGLQPLLEAALLSVNRLGRVVQIATSGPQVAVPVVLQEHMRQGAHLIGTIQGDAVTAKSIPMLIEWYRQGKLPLEKLERVYPVKNFQLARDEMKQGIAIKPILIW